MVDQATSLGAELGHMAMAVVMFYAAYRIGTWVAGRTRRLLAGWAAAICFLIICGLALGPMVNALTAAKCRSDPSPSLCADGPGQEY